MKPYCSLDMLYLWERYLEKTAGMPMRPLTDGEINLLLEDLDRKRGDNDSKK